MYVNTSRNRFKRDQYCSRTSPPCPLSRRDPLWPSAISPLAGGSNLCSKDRGRVSVEAAKIASPAKGEWPRFAAEGGSLLELAEAEGGLVRSPAKRLCENAAALFLSFKSPLGNLGTEKAKASFYKRLCQQSRTVEGEEGTIYGFHFNQNIYLFLNIFLKSTAPALSGSFTSSPLRCEERYIA